MLRGDVAESPLAVGRRELRRHQVGAFVLAGLALVAGAALLPRGDELLLIHVRNHDVGSAREVLAAGEDRGISSAASVIAHGELFLFEGRVDESLAEMEAYVGQHPSDAGAWRRLAGLYGNAQRLHDEIRALAHLYRLTPSEPLGRQLSAMYRWTADEPSEAAILQDLVARGSATADEHVRSARLQAAFGQREAALQTLEHLRGREPGGFDYPAIELYASLLLDLGHTALLAQRTQTLPLVREQPPVLEELGATMRGWGRTDAALTLFDPLPGVDASPPLLAGRARTAQGTDQAARVVSEMAELDATRPLAPEPLEAFVQLALTVSDYSAIERVLANPVRAPAPDLIAGAVGYAISHNARREAQALIAALGDDSLVDSPLLALELAVDRGDAASAERWIALVDASGNTTPEQVAALAQFEARLGLRQQAFDRLWRLAETGDAPDWALSDLTALATDLGRADQTLDLLGSLSAGAAAARGAWARLAVSAGRTELIDGWFEAGPPQRADAKTLRDIYYLLWDRRDTALALKAARRLAAASGKSDETLLLGQALLAAERPMEALEPLRRVRLESPDAALTYEAALYAALGQGGDVSAELRNVFHARLSDQHIDSRHRAMLVEGLWQIGERASLIEPILWLAREDLARWLSPLVESANASEEQDRAIALVAAALGPVGRQTDEASVDPQSSERFVRALMDLDAPDAVLAPHLERMAYGEGGTWVFAYDEHLSRAGRRLERVTLWNTIGVAQERTDDERRAAAARLVELGEPARAANVMQRLAATAGPADADLQQLLSLWGPRPGSESLEWLARRLEQAPSGEQPAWIAHLLNADGSAIVVRTFPDLPPQASPTFVGAWLDAYRATGDRGLFRNALEQVLARDNPSSSELRYAGRTALAEGFTDLAARAFQGVASREQPDLEAMRWLGAIAFYDGNTREAQRWLSAYETAGGDEAEPLYQLGELAQADHDEDGARRQYGRALERLTDPALASTNQALLANVLVRLDERNRAQAIFESLLQSDATLDHVRADYAVALLRWGDYDRARLVLQIDDAAPPVATDPGGGKRLDLLRVQWYVFRGRYGDALRVLDDLAVRVPSDPDVLLARGRFDAERGRLANADELYQAARAEAPRREDISDLLERLERERSPRASAEAGQRSVGTAWDEQMTRVRIEGRLRSHAPIAVALERMHITAPQVLRPDGASERLDAELSRFDASATVPVGVATVAAGSLFGTAHGAGIGLQVTRHDLGGASIVTAEWGRPFWDLLESAADDGRKDRLGFQRQWRVGAELSAWTFVDWNRYRLGSGARLSSTAMGLGVVRTVRRQWPTVTLQYGLDKEHRRSATVVTLADGRTIAPIPLSSREVHVFGAISRFDAFNTWETEVAGGYTLDRLGGRGSFLTARAVPRASARVGVELWVERRLYTLATTQQVFGTGLRLTARF